MIKEQIPKGETVNFANRALHALKWQYMGTILRVGFQLMVGIALARLLSPEEFGLVGMALIVIGFGGLVVGVGFGVAIIQRPSVTKEHTKAAFTGSVMMGLALFAVIWFLAPAISRVFMEDALTPVLESPPEKLFTGKRISPKERLYKPSVGAPNHFPITKESTFIAM